MIVHDLYDMISYKEDMKIRSTRHGVEDGKRTNMAEWHDEKGNVWLSGQEQIDSIRKEGFKEVPNTAFRMKEPGYGGSNVVITDANRKACGEAMLGDRVHTAQTRPMDADSVLDEWLDDEEDDMVYVASDGREFRKNDTVPTKAERSSEERPISSACQEPYMDSFQPGTYVSAADDRIEWEKCNLDHCGYIELIENGVLVMGAIVLGIFGLGVLVGKSMRRK